MLITHKWILSDVPHQKSLIRAIICLQASPRPRTCRHCLYILPLSHISLDDISHGASFVPSLTSLPSALSEAHRAIQILSRRSKNNPVLIGEPGVGKTAVAEGLAQVRMDPDSPVWLYRCDSYTLASYISYPKSRLYSPILALTAVHAVIPLSASSPTTSPRPSWGAP